MILAELYRVGGDVDFRCSRCKMELAHTVLAMVNGVPARVRCNTCHTDRKYRIPKSKAAAVQRRPTARPTTTTRPAPQSTTGVLAARTAAMAHAAAETWNAAVSKAEAHGTAPLAYSMRVAFSKGQVIEHSKFGVGVVASLSGPKKIVVIFREGEKVLIHGRKL